MTPTTPRQREWAFQPELDGESGECRNHPPALQGAWNEQAENPPVTN